MDALAPTNITVNDVSGSTLLLIPEFRTLTIFIRKLLDYHDLPFNVYPAAWRVAMEN